jgi:UDP-2,3-diacylglucosamine hydrolase
MSATNVDQRPTLFISDLHLDASRPDITAQFLDFLRTDAREAKAVYILGDLFETWIGDDDPDADKQRIQTALRELTAAGVPCFVMHGNRDFLIGEQFLRITGCQLLQDPTTVVLDGERVLLLHGDLLCTVDHAYQRLRRLTRNRFAQWLLRRLSLKRRLAMAAALRAQSQQHIAKTKEQQREAIMDVNASAVSETFKANRVHRMIHGHTHRPAVHPLAIDGQAATRIVLGDWYTQGSVLRVTNGRYDLQAIPRS